MAAPANVAGSIAPRPRIFYTIDEDDDCTTRFTELMEGPAGEEDL